MLPVLPALLLAAQAPSIPLPAADAGLAALAELDPGAASTFRAARFGHDLAVDADRLVVGSPEFKADGQAQGRVRFFERTGAGDWLATFALTLPAPPESVNGRLGFSVDLEGDVAVVGAPDWAAPGPVLGAGRAFVLERRADAGWELMQVLEPSDPGSGSGPTVHFGRAVDLDGDQLAVTSDFGSGTHVYRRAANGLFEVEAVLPPPANAEEGQDVALEDDQLLVVAWEYVPDTYTWGVRHWQRTVNGWVDRGLLTGVGDGASYLTSLALAEGRLAVGLPFDSTAGYKTGRVELYELGPDGAFAPEASLVAPATQPSDHFGVAVAWAEGALFASAHLSDLGGLDRGAVWRFERLAGSWRATGRAIGKGEPAQFGFSLAATRDELFVGVPERSTAFDAMLDDEPSGAVEHFTHRPLRAAPEKLSAATGGRQELVLEAGPDAAALAYLVLGSATAPQPLLDRAGGPRLPLVVDGYTLAMVAGAGAPPWPGCAGATDSSGRAEAAIELPPLPPSAAGTVLHHAAVVLAPSEPWPLVTDAVRLLVGP